VKERGWQQELVPQLEEGKIHIPSSFSTPGTMLPASSVKTNGNDSEEQYAVAIGAFVMCPRRQ
jgi:hypothetical protein